MSLTNCRFYEEKYPEVESFVMVNVKQIAEMGAYVKLLEYGKSTLRPCVQVAELSTLPGSVHYTVCAPYQGIMALTVQTTLTA